VGPASANVAVSVILPARNAERWLLGALVSLQAQTFLDFEIIVVDDHSADATPALARAFATTDPRVRLVLNNGRGLVAALTTGISNARAPLIARMDADDLARPERLAKQVAFLAVRPEIALVGTQVQPIDAQGLSIGGSSGFPTAPKAMSDALINRGCVIRHPTVLMRRAALEAVGGYRSATEQAEDFDLWLRLDEKYQLANLPDVLLDYRVHSGQISHGLNWRQRFARDAALVAAFARRAGEVDPLSSFAAPFDLEDPELLADPRLTPALRRLVVAYASARAVTDARYSTMEPDFAAMVQAARTGLFGEGRQVRASILRHGARAALRGGRPIRALECFITALRIAPGRAFSMAG
jgi:hypothetical protein